MKSMNFSITALALSLVLTGCGREDGLGDDGKVVFGGDLGVDNVDWMDSLPDDRLLRHVSMPGTHDSMAYKLKKVEIYGRTQDANLLEQLDGGIRAFDLRVYCEGSTLKFAHGIKSIDIELGTALSEMVSFLDQNPSETIIARIAKERDNDDCDEAGRLSLLQQEFDDSSVNPYIYNDSSYNAKMRDVRKKIVVKVQYFGKRPIGYSDIDYFSSDSQIQDEYEVATGFQFESKETFITDHFDDMPSDGDTSYWVNYISGAGAFATPAAVAGGKNGRDGMNQRTYNYLSGSGTDFAGMVMMDFPGSDLINLIIEKN